MSTRPAKFCDHHDCDELEAADKRYSSFRACELCGGDFCNSHHRTKELADTAFTTPPLKTELCERCTKFANSVFGKGTTAVIESTRLQLGTLINEHLKAAWAERALLLKKAEK